MIQKESVYRTKRHLRRGYTTGSCAAAAAKACAIDLLMGFECHEVKLITPDKTTLCLPIHERKQDGEWRTYAVKKDAGDDPDVTHGVLVYASVRKLAENEIRIDGGVGVGRVTKEGLDQPVGAAAINSSPRKMVRSALEEVKQETEYMGGFDVIISIPDGEKLAQKTFNPRLGIVGGISVLGTTGIVEPMSEKALTESILLELNILAKKGIETVMMTPGNYGEVFAEKTLGLPKNGFVQCSNFIGDSLDMAVTCGIKRVLLVGHIGKLVKLAGGIMQTHSSYADCRMELIALYAAMHGADTTLVQKIMQAVVTDDALDILKKADLLEPVVKSLMEKIEYYLTQRCGDDLEQIGTVMFSNRFGILGQTSKAEPLMEHLKKQKLGE